MPAESETPGGGENTGTDGLDSTNQTADPLDIQVERNSELILQYDVPTDDADERFIKDTVNNACDSELLVPFVFIERIDKQVTGKIKIHFINHNALGLWRNCDEDLRPDHWVLASPVENAESRGVCHIVVYGIPAGVSAENFLADQAMVRPDTFEHCEMYEKTVEETTTCTAFCWFTGGPSSIVARKCFAKGVYYMNTKYRHRRRDINKREKELKHSFILTNQPAAAHSRRIENCLLNAAIKQDASIVSRDVLIRTEDLEETLGTGCTKITTNSKVFVAAAQQVISSDSGLVLLGQKIRIFGDIGEYWAIRSREQESAQKPPPPPPPPPTQGWGVPQNTESVPPRQPWGTTRAAGSTSRGLGPCWLKTGNNDYPMVPNAPKLAITRA